MSPRTKRSRAAEENFNKRKDQQLLIRNSEDNGYQGQMFLILMRSFPALNKVLAKILITNQIKLF